MLAPLLDAVTALLDPNLYPHLDPFWTLLNLDPHLDPSRPSPFVPEDALNV